MEALKKYLDRRIKHAEQRVKELKEMHGDNPGRTHTYHGGWDLGYWEGRLTAYQAIRDTIV